MTATIAGAAAGAPAERLPLWRRIAYGAGDVYGGGSMIVVGFYYLIFLTDVVRISPALAGTVILISKAYDAVTDPFEGVISDRTRTRLGRRRPYLLAGIPLVFLSFFALFYPVAGASEIGRFAFVLLTYLFFSTILSFVCLNYNALQAEITLDYNERTALSSIRIFFSTVSSIVAALLPLEIVKAAPDVRQGYILMGLVFGIIFALPFVVTFFGTRERREFQQPPERFNLAAALQPFRVRTFVYALLMYLFAFVAMDAVSSIVVYFMKYYMGRGGEANYVAGTLLVFQVIALPFYVALSRRTSKRAGFITGGCIWFAAMFTSFLITPGSPWLMVYLFAAIIGLGTGGMVVMIYAIFPDIPDVDELRSGRRREGTYGAMMSFSRKLSSAIALFAVANVIGLAGYVRPAEQIVGGAARLIEQPQPASFILALRLLFAFLPALLVAVAIFFARRYPLDKPMHSRLSNLLARRREGLAETPESQAEAERLERLLIGRRG